MCCIFTIAFALASSRRYRLPSYGRFPSLSQPKLPPLPTIPMHENKSFPASPIIGRSAEMSRARLDEDRGEEVAWGLVDEEGGPGPP